jgi:hypothetical protein
MPWRRPGGAIPSRLFVHQAHQMLQMFAPDSKFSQEQLDNLGG